jgi:hypothetical protein
MPRFRDVLTLILSAAPPFFFMWTYTGPFQWLAELDLKIEGHYDESFILVIVMLLWVGVLAGVYAIMRQANPDLPPFSEFMSSRTSARAIAAGSVAVPLCLVGYGVYQFITTRAMKDPVPLKLADYAAGGSLPSRYVSVESVDAIDDVHGVTKKYHSTDWYLPLVPAGAGKGAAIPAFIQYGAVGDKPAPTKKFVGVVGFAPVPGMVRVALERDGLQVSRRNIVIDTTETPEGQRTTGLLMIAAGIAVGLFGWIRLPRGRAAQVAKSP